MACQRLPSRRPGSRRPGSCGRGLPTVSRYFHLHSWFGVTHTVVVAQAPNNFPTPRAPLNGAARTAELRRRLREAEHGSPSVQQHSADGSVATATTTAYAQRPPPEPEPAIGGPLQAGLGSPPGQPAVRRSYRERVHPAAVPAPGGGLEGATPHYTTGVPRRYARAYREPTSGGSGASSPQTEQHLRQQGATGGRTSSPPADARSRPPTPARAPRIHNGGDGGGSDEMCATPLPTTLGPAASGRGTPPDSDEAGEENAGGGERRRLFGGEEEGGEKNENTGSVDQQRDREAATPHDRERNVHAARGGGFTAGDITRERALSTRIAFSSRGRSRPVTPPRKSSRTAPGNSSSTRALLQAQQETKRVQFAPVIARSDSQPGTALLHFSG